MMMTATDDDDARARLRKEAGQWVKHRRESIGLSQRDLAEAIEVSYYTFVSQIESGRGRIPPERYGIWARALKIEPREFVRLMMSYYEPAVFSILFSDCQNESERRDRIDQPQPDADRHLA